MLLDVRNAYETEIGRFEITSNDGESVLVPVHDPLTRTVRRLSLFFYYVNSSLTLNDILITMQRSLKRRRS